MLFTATLIIHGTTACEMEIEARRRFTALFGPEMNGSGEMRWCIRPASLTAKSVEVSNVETGHHELVDVDWCGEFQAVTCR